MNLSGMSEIDKEKLNEGDNYKHNANMSQNLLKKNIYHFHDGTMFRKITYPNPGTESVTPKLKKPYQEEYRIPRSRLDSHFSAQVL